MPGALSAKALLIRQLPSQVFASWNQAVQG